jgi:hypothetical protein
MQESQDELEQLEEEEEVAITETTTTLLKPVFLSKADREALQASKEKQQQDQEVLEEQQFLQSQRELRKTYTK